MTNILCTRKNNRFVRSFTEHSISNTDQETHNTFFSMNKRIFRSSIAKSTHRDTDTSIIGYYQYNWGPMPDTNIPQCCNLGVAFTGWADPATALTQSSSIYAGLQGSKYITLGGGYGSDNTPNAGKFNSTVLANILTAINAGNFSAYSGIIFDVEYCDTSGLYASGFKPVFAAAKNKQLTVIISVGHSGNITDISGGQDIDLMTSFLSDPNVDYLSPQLYSNGNENPPQYNENGVKWSAWANSGKKIVASIPWCQQYEAVETWFSVNARITLSGFIQWNNTAYSGGGGNLNVTLTVTNNTDYKLTILAGTSDLTPASTILTKGQSLTNAKTTSSSSTINMNFSNGNSGDISYAVGTMGATLGWQNPGNIVMNITVNGQNYGPFNDGNWHQLTSVFASGSTISVIYSQ